MKSRGRKPIVPEANTKSFDATQITLIMETRFGALQEEDDQPKPIKTHPRNL